VKKNIDPTCLGYKKVVTCSTEAEAGGLTPTFAMNTSKSSGLPDKIIFQFIVFTYTPIWAFFPNAVSLPLGKTTVHSVCIHM